MNGRLGLVDGGEADGGGVRGTDTGDALELAEVQAENQGDGRVAPSDGCLGDLTLPGYSP